jgi:hypothetical protein
MCLGVSTLGGIALSAEDQGSREAALQWLQVGDSGNYKDAALMLSEQVRVKRDWTNYLGANRVRLGRLNKREIIEVKHRSTIPGAAEIRNYDTIRFKTSFERKPVAFEEVVTAKIGCCWEIFGYEIK